jgi:hypothetical protein
MPLSKLDIECPYQCELPLTLHAVKVEKVRLAPAAAVLKILDPTAKWQYCRKLLEFDQGLRLRLPHRQAGVAK